MTLAVACLLKLVIWDPCYKTKVGGRLKRSWFYRLANRRSVKQGLFSLQCRRILGGRKLVHVRIATMKPPSLIFWQRKIGESRNSNPGILTTTFPEGFMYTIFMPSLGKSSIFNRCSISSSLFDTVDGMWFSVKERDFLDLPFADVELSIEGDCRRIDTDGFGFSACWTGFVRRVESTFAAPNWGTFRGCYCSSN